MGHHVACVAIQGRSSESISFITQSALGFLLPVIPETHTNLVIQNEISYVLLYFCIPHCIFKQVFYFQIKTNTYIVYSVTLVNLL